MDIIQQTRELGKLIQKDERYIAYFNAREKNDNDPELQKLISEFNMKRLDLNNEMSKDEKDAEKLKELDNTIKELYGNIMANENMNTFTAVKNEMDAEKLKELDNTIKELYGNIMANENMNTFTAVKNEMDSMLSQINNIITMSANGEDPETCVASSGCSGSCSSCSGCH